MGVGIHGEPGRTREPLRPAAEIAEQLVSSILADHDFSGAPVIAMLSGLGGTPLIELYLMYGDIAAQLEQRGITVARTLVGDYITSLDMAGCSLTLLRADDEMLALGRPRGHARARWGLSGCRSTSRTAALTVDDLIAWMLRFHDEQVSRSGRTPDEARLAIGDADHGTNMARGTAAVRLRLRQARPEDAASVLKSSVHGARVSAGRRERERMLYGTLFLEMGQPRRHGLRSSTPRSSPTRSAPASPGSWPGVGPSRATRQWWTRSSRSSEALSLAAAAGRPLAESLQAAAAAASTVEDASIPLVARKGRPATWAIAAPSNPIPGAASAAILVQALADSHAERQDDRRRHRVAQSLDWPKPRSSWYTDGARRSAPIRIAAGARARSERMPRTVAAAVDEVGAATDVTGVLVIPDLGSAVLSAGLALEFRESTTEVVVSSGPFAEGITAGLVLAATGAPLEEVAREVAAALDEAGPVGAVTRELPDPSRGSPPVSRGPRSADEVLVNPEGPPRQARGDARAGGRRLRRPHRRDEPHHGRRSGPAKSLIGLLSLGAKQGHRIRLDGRGPDAATAVSALRGLLVDGFGEVAASAAS